MQMMSLRKISELPVVDSEGRPLGIVDITDLISIAGAAATRSTGKATWPPGSFTARSTRETTLSARAATSGTSRTAAGTSGSATRTGSTNNAHAPATRDFTHLSAGTDDSATRQ